MTGARLILRSFAKLVSVDLGIDTANVLTLQVEPLDNDGDMRRNYYASLAETLRRFPEVASAGAIDHSALNGGRPHPFHGIGEIPAHLRRTVNSLSATRLADRLVS